MAGRFKLVKYVQTESMDYEVLAIFDSQSMRWVFDHGWEDLPVHRIGRLSLHDTAIMALRDHYPGIQLRDRGTFTA